MRYEQNIGFNHQAWLDDFQARNFRYSADMCAFVYRKQDGLFSRSTIFRWFKSGLFYSKAEVLAKYPNRVIKKRNDFITHKNSIGETVYTLYYKSIHKVKEILGIECLGYRVFGNTEHITKDNRKLTAFEVIAEGLQGASAKAERRKNKKTKAKKSILDPNDIFNGNSDITTSTPYGKITSGVKLKGSRVLVNTDHAGVIGVSQTLIGKTISRHRTTVSRHLKAKEHKSIFVTNAALTTNMVEQFSNTGKSYLIDSVTGIPYFKFGNTVYRKYTNLYKNDWDVLPYDSKHIDTHKEKYSESTLVVLKVYKSADVLIQEEREWIQSKIQKDYKYQYYNSGNKTTNYNRGNVMLEYILVHCTFLITGLWLESFFAYFRNFHEKINKSSVLYSCITLPLL